LHQQHHFLVNETIILRDGIVNTTIAEAASLHTKNFAQEAAFFCSLAYSLYQFFAGYYKPEVEFITVN